MLMRDFNIYMSGRNPRPIDGSYFQLEIADSELRYLHGKGLAINSGSDQSAEDHVPACTGKTIEIECSHENTSVAFFARKWKR